MSNTPNESHDLDTQDLRLTPQSPHIHRDFIAPQQQEEDANAPAVLLTPQMPSHSDTHKKKKKHRLLKVLLIILCVLLCLAVTAVTVFFVLRAHGEKELLPQGPVELIIPEEIVQNPEVEVEDNGRTILYKGERYAFNEDRTNILCIGIDKETMGLENGLVGTGGQADVLMLVSIDTQTGELDALAISRDTMADIAIYASDGSFHSMENTQICLAYAYGNGRETSCENTVSAVSRLLYSIPINTYFAMDVSSIAVANDAIGGVEVTLLSDLVRNDGSVAYAGQTVTLYGEEAHRYVRSRDTEQLDSNNDRMERQKQYLSAFFNKALAASSQDLQVPLELFNAVSADSVTNLNASKITFLSTTLVQHHSALEFASVPGTVTLGDDGYAEYRVDQQALYEQVLSIFFKKV